MFLLDLDWKFPQRRKKEVLLSQLNFLTTRVVYNCFSLYDWVVLLPLFPQKRVVYNICMQVHIFLCTVCFVDRLFTQEANLG
jgi:hypothetical protein